MTGCITVVALLSISVIYISFILSSSKAPSKHFTTVVKDRWIPQTVFFETSAPSRIQCAGVCLRNVKCSAFNYRESDGVCKLLEAVQKPCDWVAKHEDPGTMIMMSQPEQSEVPYIYKSVTNDLEIKIKTPRSGMEKGLLSYNENKEIIILITSTFPQGVYFELFKRKANTLESFYFQTLNINGYILANAGDHFLVGTLSHQAFFDLYGHWQTNVTLKGKDTVGDIKAMSFDKLMQYAVIAMLEKIVICTVKVAQESKLCIINQKSVNKVTSYNDFRPILAWSESGDLIDIHADVPKAYLNIFGRCANFSTTIPLFSLFHHGIKKVKDARWSDEQRGLQILYQTAHRSAIEPRIAYLPWISANGSYFFGVEPVANFSGITTGYIPYFLSFRHNVVYVLVNRSTTGPDTFRLLLKQSK